MKKWFEGQKVHVSKDDAQWGRIAEDCEVVEVRTKSLLVIVGGTLRANVIVAKRDANPIAQNRADK